jgi:hypothetical protein
MGESIWLFLHMLDRADWESGKVLEWKDEAEAEDMGMPVRTLREHRRKLEELDYISCDQKQYGQEITIHNWTNPREYSGIVTNQKQGGKEPSPSPYIQGDTQGYIQGSRKDVTPTSYSKNQTPLANEPPKRTNELPLEWQILAGVDEVVQPDLELAKRLDFANIIGIGTNDPITAREIAMAFQTHRNITLPGSKVKGQRKAIKEMLEMNVNGAHVTQAVHQLMAKGMTVADLFSVIKTAIDIANKPEEKIEYYKEL